MAIPASLGLVGWWLSAIGCLCHVADCSSASLVSAVVPLSLYCFVTSPQKTKRKQNQTNKQKIVYQTPLKCDPSLFVSYPSSAILD